MGRVMEDFYLYALTGKTSHDNPEAIYSGLLEKLPENILNADPISGSWLLKGYLKKQLAKGGSQGTTD